MMFFLLPSPPHKQKKYGSADDLTEIGNPFPSGHSTRTSVPIITLGGKPGTPPLPGVFIGLSVCLSVCLSVYFVYVYVRGEYVSA